MKRLSILLVTSALLLAILSSSCESQPTQPQPTAEAAQTTLENVNYTIVEEEDLSYATAVRKSVRVAVYEDMTKAEIEWIVKDVVNKITESQPVNAIAVFIYHSGTIWH